MALNLFDLSKIRDKVKKLTGRVGEGAITDAELDLYINRYYQLVFPLELRPLELNTWFEATLTAGTDTYTLASLSFDDSYLTFDKPLTINGESMLLFLNPEEFYSLYPETQTYDNGQPEAVLLYDNELVFRKPPDSTYISFKASALARPEALVNDGDIPIREEWGALISYGASIELLEDNAEMEAMQVITPMYDRHKRNIMGKVHKQFINQRSNPTF